MPALLFRAIDRLHQIGCGHTDVLRFGAGRVWLECLECGRETRGILTKLPATRSREALRSSASRVSAPSGVRVSVRSAA
jgi:hypothetical protein